MPTVKPTNEIIRIAEDTVNLPSTGKVNKQIPSYDLRTVGYDKNKRIFAEELNYTLDNIGQWCQYFENRVDELQAQIEKERVSIGELIEITGDSTNPSVLKGYGTWEYFGEGLTTIGVGTHTDDRSEELTFTDGQTLGEYNHIQTVQELASHVHEDNFSATSSDAGGHSHTGTMGDNRDTSSRLNVIANANTADAGTTYTTGSVDDHTHTINLAGGVLESGESSPMNNIQPSVAVYRWKRVS